MKSLKKTIILFFLLLLPACWKEKYPKDVQKIIDKGTLIVSVYADDMPPFFMKDEKGELIGCDIDIAKAIAKRLGVKPVFIRNGTRFNDVVDIVAEGDADIAVSKLTTTPSRYKKGYFSKSYLIMRRAFLCNRSLLKKAKVDESYSKIFEYMKQKKEKIHALEGSAYVEFLKIAFPGAPIETHPNLNSLLSTIEKGQGLCAFRDEFDVQGYFLKHPGNKFDVLYVIMDDFKYNIHVFVNKKYKNLVPVIDSVIEVGQSARTIKFLMERYKKYLDRQGG